MARRRAWGTGQRLGYGLATGAQQMFAELMRSLQQQRNAASIAARQEAQDARTLERMGKMEEARTANETRKSLITRIGDVSTGSLTPEAFMAMMQAGGVDLLPTQTPRDEVGTGEYAREREANTAATREFVEGVRPPLRRRLEGVVGKRIDDATTPEALEPGGIVGQLRATDGAVGLGDEFLVDPTDPGQQGMALVPEAQEYLRRAQDKAQALRSKPGERLTITNPDGSKSVSTPSIADFARGPIQIEPTSAQQGALKGEEEKATLNVVGGARAQQAGAEGYARESGAINAKLDNAKRLIDFDTQQALAKLKVTGMEVDARKAAEAIADARESATRAAPAIDQLQKTWLLAQPAIAQLAGSSVIGRAALGFQESYRPTSTLPQNVKNYSDLVDAVRPMLAKAFGQVGNPALTEQEWAKYVPNYSDALNPNDALMKLARLEALMSSQVALATAARDKGVLSGADIDAIIEPRIEGAYNALVEMSRQVTPGTQPRPMTIQGIGNEPLQPGATVEFNLTPSGFQLVPPRR